MTAPITDLQRASGVPDEVRDTAATPRAPQADPTVGVPVVLQPVGDPPHRLVTIGDSLTHGVQSGAVFNTDLSYPAIVAHELGWPDFRFPTYNGFGGLPLNLELLLRELEHRYGDQLNVLELPLALFRARRFLDQVDTYWESGPGAQPPLPAPLGHNLAVFGWDLRDALSKTAASCTASIGQRERGDLLIPRVSRSGDRAALRVFPSAPELAELTVFGAAAELGRDTRGADNGIETLVIFLGANNALSAVTSMKLAWSGDGYDDPVRKKDFTVWQPAHFAAELAEVATRVRGIAARHVIWCTVPHVTIAPIVRGVGTKVEPGSAYYPYYTRPWTTDRDFDVRHDPHITAAQALAVDTAIDRYNDSIVETVRTERQAGRDWYVLDLAGVLDRLAARRYLNDELARPQWWTPYELPPDLLALTPVPDTRFLTCAGRARAAGGLFSLDGLHPTTVGYGIIAQELVNVMRLAGVEFLRTDGTARPDPVKVDFQRLIRRDTLLSTPPGNVTSTLNLIRWADETLDFFRRVFD